MYNRTGHGWNSLTRNQKIGVTIVGLLVLYALLAGSGGGGFLGRLTDPSWILAAAAIVFIAFPVHEMAHAATAVHLGDNTPKAQGRYTFNPLPHIDPLGAILIFLSGFGWAKPVSWNPRNLDIDRRLGIILVAMAGPVSNLVLATLMFFVLRLLLQGAGDQSGLLLSLVRPGGFFFDFVGFFAHINVILFIFNLIPVPPLDGSHVLFALLPGNTYKLQMQLARYGFALLFVIIFLAPQLIIGPVRLIESGLQSLIF